MILKNLFQRNFFCPQSACGVSTRQIRKARGFSRQTGLTLVEVIVSLAILSAATIGMSMVADRFSQETKGSVTAAQMRVFGEASKAYIKDNYAAVQLIATPGVPARIDVPTLIAAGKLPVGFLPTNAFGQSMCTLVLEPVVDRLQAMVVAEGGLAIEDLALGSLAAAIGGSGGGVYASDAATMRGAIGGWSLPTTAYDNLSNMPSPSRRCDGGAGNVRLTPGHPLMALWFENGDTSSAFLSRAAVPGRPELNAMNTPLVMNAVQVLDGACTTAGAIAQDGAGALLSCQAGLWKTATHNNGDRCLRTSSNLDSLQKDGRCYNGANLPNSPAGSDWVFVEVFKNVDPSHFIAQRVVGMTGAAVGRVWQRNQLSSAQAGGWGAWVQQADSQVGINAGGNIVAAGSVTAKQGNFSGDGLGTCCSPVAPSLSVSEYTAVTGRNPGIQFHAGGLAEGRIDLDGGGNINMKNSGGGGLGLNVGNVNSGSINSVGIVSTRVETWGAMLRDGSGNDNSQRQSAVGSAYVNDIYIRSAGKWASELGRVPFNNSFVIPPGAGGVGEGFYRNAFSYTFPVSASNVTVSGNIDAGMDKQYGFYYIRNGSVLDQLFLNYNGSYGPAASSFSYNLGNVAAGETIVFQVYLWGSYGSDAINSGNVSLTGIWN